MKERKLRRLNEYNYSESGYYFVTICIKDRKEYLGKIEDGRMVLNMWRLPKILGVKCPYILSTLRSMGLNNA